MKPACPRPLLGLLVAAVCGGSALAQDRAPSRGELLYTTHCVACHTTQMHWRDKKLATDWPSLKSQVQRWQARASLDWSDADVTEVARYLNDTIYRHPQTSGQVGWAAPR
jgi:mono/diheme cytochrome c family protein